MLRTNSPYINRFRQDINGLRGLAVILVVLFHFGIGGFSGGFVGVDVFFVISGYLMTSLIFSKLDKNSFNIAEFYINRSYRIIPALAFLCLVLVLVGSVLLFPDDFRVLSKNVIASNLFFSNFQFLSQAGYFDSASDENWLLHTWSLSAEWQFYIVYPLLITFLTKVLDEIYIKYVLIFLAITSLLSSILLTSIFPESSYFMLHTRAWEMIAGGLLCFFKLNINSKYKSVTDFLGFSLILISSFYFDKATPWPSGYALYAVVGVMLIISTESEKRTFISNNILQWFGKISYSLYLWHWPIYVVLGYFSLESNELYVVFGIFLSILLSILSYKYIEVPCLKLKDHTRTLKTSCIIGFIIILPTSIGTFVYLNNGMLSRFDEQNIKLVEATTDWNYPKANKISNGSNLRVIGKSENKVLFIGDSLVEQYYSWAEQLAAKPNTNVSFIFQTSGGCSPIRGTYKDRNTCNNLNNSLGVATSENVRRVIIGAYWVDYFLENTGGAYYLTSNVKVRTNSLKGREIGMEKLASLIREFKSNNIEVTLILPTPLSSNFDPKNIYKERLFFNSESEYSSIKVEYPSLYELKNELAVLAKKNGAQTIDPFDFLCQEGNVCTYLDDNNEPYYMDKIHLRASTVINKVNYLNIIIKEFPEP